MFHQDEGALVVWVVRQLFLVAKTVAERQTRNHPQIWVFF